MRLLTFGNRIITLTERDWKQLCERYEPTLEGFKKESERLLIRESPCICSYYACMSVEIYRTLCPLWKCTALRQELLTGVDYKRVIDFDTRSVFILGADAAEAGLKVMKIIYDWLQTAKKK